MGRSGKREEISDEGWEALRSFLGRLGCAFLATSQCAHSAFPVIYLLTQATRNTQGSR
jgi:hypothetical protein